MRLKQLFVYLGVVVLLCCTLSSRAEDDVADVEDEDEVESDSESEQEDKASGDSGYISVLNCSKRSKIWFNCISYRWQGKEKKKVEIESYSPPVIALEHEDSVFFAEPFAKRGEFESR